VGDLGDAVVTGEEPSEPTRPGFDGAVSDPEPSEPTRPGLDGAVTDPDLDRRRHTRVSRWLDAARTHPLVDRAVSNGRELVRQRPREVALAAAGGALAIIVLIGFVSCSSGGDDHSQVPVAQPTVFSAPPPEPSGPRLPSPTTTRATDGCRGLISAAQVSSAAGVAVTGSGGDAAAAVSGYADAVRAEGLEANVRLCPFGNSGGDQVYVLAMTFADAAQATRMYASGKVGPAGSVPVPGVGDAAATDGVSTLLTRRGRSVVLVFLIRPKQPTVNHGGALRAVALAALARV
jgi:hypothetical protein